MCVSHLPGCSQLWYIFHLQQQTVGKNSESADLFPLPCDSFILLPASDSPRLCSIFHAVSSKSLSAPVLHLSLRHPSTRAQAAATSCSEKPAPDPTRTWTHITLWMNVHAVVTSQLQTPRGRLFTPTGVYMFVKNTTSDQSVLHQTLEQMLERRQQQQQQQVELWSLRRIRRIRISCGWSFVLSLPPIIRHNMKNKRKRSKDSVTIQTQEALRSYSCLQKGILELNTPHIFLNHTSHEQMEPELQIRLI